MWANILRERLAIGSEEIEMRKSLLWKSVCMLLTIGLPGCGPVIPVAPGNAVAPTANSLPATPATLPRWRLYERALGDILNGPAGNTHPDVSRDHGICEWEIWGQNGKDVYVWALCEVHFQGSPVTATSAPAIVRLGQNDEITQVIMPAEGWGNIRSLFPESVLTRIFKRDFDVAGAEKQIGLRHQDPSVPPGIVQAGVALP